MTGVLNALAGCYGSAGASSKTPDQVSGLMWWYDSSNAGSITYGSSPSVSQWNDLSGNGHNLTQSTGANQPTVSGTLNSLNLMAFSGSQWFSDSSFTMNNNQITFFGVLKRSPVWRNDSIWSHGLGATAGHGMAFRQDTYSNWVGGDLVMMGAGYEATQKPMTVAQAPSVASDTSFHQIDMGIGPDAYMAQDGSNKTLRYSDTTNAGSVTDVLLIGSFNPSGGDAFQGWMGEIFAYGTAAGLSTGDKTALRTYLKNKWATP